MFMINFMLLKWRVVCPLLIRISTGSCHLRTFTNIDDVLHKVAFLMEKLGN